MGISGLLRVLKDGMERKQLESFRGQVAAVDALGWLHRGTYCCSTEICIEGDWSKCISYCMKRVDMLRHFGITPLMVFDGDNLPMKRLTEEGRQERRQKSLEQGMEYYNKGRHSEAAQAFTKAVDVSPAVIRLLIDKLEEFKIDFVVAPYEADAQLAYLQRTGKADFIISEDSDCIAFGCDRILFKLDNEASGDYFESSVLKTHAKLKMQDFDHDMILDMCILAGCDYLDSLPGMGVIKAQKLVKKHRKTDRILKGIRYEGKLAVPRDYELRFHQARLTFRHQLVQPFKADPPLHGLVPLQDIDHSDLQKIPDEERHLPFAGAHLDPHLATQIAQGKVNAITKVPFSHESGLAPSHRKHGLERSMSAQSFQMGHQIRGSGPYAKGQFPHRSATMPMNQRRDIYSQNYSGNYRGSQLAVPQKKKAGPILNFFKRRAEAEAKSNPAPKTPINTNQIASGSNAVTATSSASCSVRLRETPPPKSSGNRSRHFNSFVKTQTANERVEAGQTDRDRELLIEENTESLVIAVAPEVTTVMATNKRIAQTRITNDIENLYPQASTTEAQTPTKALKQEHSSTMKSPGVNDVQSKQCLGDRSQSRERLKSQELQDVSNVLKDDLERNAPIISLDLSSYCSPEPKKPNAKVNQITVLKRTTPGDDILNSAITGKLIDTLSDDEENGGLLTLGSGVKPTPSKRQKPNQTATASSGKSSTTNPFRAYKFSSTSLRLNLSP